MNHFSKQTLSALAKKGITLIGLTVIPDNTSPMPMANGSTGYCLDDNGTYRIRTFLQVLEMAN